MKTRKREIAKAGIYGSKDDPVIVNEKELQEIAETFAEVKTAPVVFGHWPAADEPRLGNVTAVSYDPATKSLIGDIEEEDALAEAVDAGYYPDVSIRSKQRATDGKMYLVHLAYLGQEAPKIKDLVKNIKEPLGIAASENEGLRKFPSPSERQLYLSETPPVIKKNLDSKLEETPAAGAGQPSSPGGCEAPGAADGGSDSANSNKESSMTEQEAQALREENERLKKEAEQKELALSEASKERRLAARERLKTVMNGKGMPKPVQEKVLSLSDSLEDGKVIELSDSDAAEGKRKVSAADCLIEIVSAFTKPVEPGKLDLSEGEEPAGNAGQIDFAKI